MSFQTFAAAGLLALAIVPLVALLVWSLRPERSLSEIIQEARR